MTDEPTKTDTEAAPVALADAFAKPAKRVRGRKKKTEPEKPPAPVPASPVARRGLPIVLPEDAPVKALGTREGEYYFLDSLGQIRHLPEGSIGRTHILSLFGGDQYLKQTWPIFRFDETEGKWIEQDKFDHDKMAPVLIASCTTRGVWDPSDKVRGCGTWAEESGALVMHCGERLYRTKDRVVHNERAGVQGALLYPRRPPLPEPLFEGTRDAGPAILDQLYTWNWKRNEIDPKLALGWLVASFIGQAALWRPMLWVTGGKGTGKSTLLRLFEWVHSKSALIMPSNTSQAFIYQKIGDSSLPVALDEFEAKEDNRRVQDVIDLMRIAASGGELGRGGSENNPKTYVLKSCFCAFSILIPPLTPQDISRMAILQLGQLSRNKQDPELQFSAPAEYDLALGNRERWSREGRRLRARVLEQWHRYPQTYNSYFYALMQQGHDSRAASQFGSLGAGYDLAMYETFSAAHALDWAKMLPARDLAETKGHVDEPEACLQFLLASTADLARHGTHETIRFYLDRARRDLDEGSRTNDPDDANRILAKIGIRVYRDAERISIDTKTGKEGPLWWIAISNTHAKLGEIFKETHWKGRPGSPGTWAQALRNLPGADDRPMQMRIDNAKYWVTRLMWDAVFPPFDETNDAAEIAAVDIKDRLRTETERAA